MKINPQYRVIYFFIYGYAHNTINVKMKDLMVTVKLKDVISLN